MAQDTAKIRIIRDLQGDLLDSNHATRRFFRLWLDGSYLGEEHYKDNIAFMRTALKRSGDKWHKFESACRSWVIMQFVRYTAHDAQCSYSHAQKVIVATVDRATLNELTEHLITDAWDLIQDDIDAHLKEQA